VVDDMFDEIWSSSLFFRSVKDNRLLSSQESLHLWHKNYKDLSLFKINSESILTPFFAQFSHLGTYFGKLTLTFSFWVFSGYK
jgi:hypothetical protein